MDSMFIKLCKLGFFSVFGLFTISRVYAAPAVPSPVCAVQGLVKKIETRKVDYKPESWRKSWGLAKARVYTDVTVKVLDAKGLNNKEPYCDRFLGLKTFQLQDKVTKIKVSKCISAKTQFSGDEFAIGQWLFNVQEQKKESCR